MAVLTISRQFGSGGDEIADRVGQILGYRHFDKSLILQAAKEAGLSEEEITDFSEESYKAKSFFERLFGRSHTVMEVRVWRETAQGVRVPEISRLDEDHALHLVRGAVEAAYRAGNIIIIGRGGQVILKDRPDVLHLRIEAPMEDRIQRIKVSNKLERRAAQDLIEERDLASADYLKRFYGIDWADPQLYHMVLNTGKLDLDLAAQFVVEIAHCVEPVPA